MKEIQIGERIIGAEHPPFVIAEVGINHEGDYGKAIELVDAARQAGADCIKFQCHITEAEMVHTDMKPGDISDESLWDIIKRCELTEQEELDIKSYCDRSGILYLSTPFSREAADRLQQMGVLAFKIGSGECNNGPLLKHVSKFGKPIILSTGMNNLESIRKSVSLIGNYNSQLALTHCTSMYPTPYSKVRLGAIPQMIKEFDLPIGLSDHSLGIYTCLGAVALGACILEKHFTISKTWPGPDIPVSITPDELTELVKGAKAVFEARGGTKQILSEEQGVIDFAYASVCTIAEVKKGEEFTSLNLWVKRPGVGEIQAMEYESILGKKASRDLPADSLLRRDDCQ